MNVIVQLEANVQWSVQQSATSKRWTGVCDPMNITTEADTLDELQGVINESMQLLLTDLLHDNELDRFLRERGWTARNLPKVGEDEAVFDFPWELVVRGKSLDSERRAH